MLKKSFALFILLVAFCLGGTFSKNTGIILTDNSGKSYDVDALIASGKHIVIHQTGST